MNESETNQLIADEAALGLKSLFYFNKYILGYEQMVEPLHRDLCNNVSTNPGKHKLVLMPRGSFKSSVVTVGKSVWDITNNPNIRILIASETYQNAQKFLREIKGHFERGEEFRRHYGDWVPKEGWTETEITVNKRTKNFKEPTITTAGVDVTKVGMHYDIIYVDDPMSQNNTGNSEAMDKVKDWYKLLFSLLEPTGQMIVIGTRWDDSDLYGYIIESEEERKKEGKPSQFEITLRKATEDDGTLAFPQRLTREFLDNQLKLQGSYIFNAQYQNDPVPRDEAVLGNIVYYRDEDVIGKHLTKFMAVDPAISEKETADYSAIVVVGVDQDQNWYVLVALQKRCQPKELIDTIIATYELHRPTKIALEQVAFQKSLTYYIAEEQKKRGVWLPIFEAKADTDKLRRILTLQPRFELGQVKIKKDMEDLEYQLRRFPRAKHDDLLDSLAFVEQIVYYPRPERRLKDYEPENSITGY